MASIRLDTQIFYTPPVAADPKPTSRNLGPSAFRYPQDDVVVISDNELDFGFGDDLEELFRQSVTHKDVESGSIAGIGIGIGMYPSSPSSKSLR